VGGGSQSAEVWDPVTLSFSPAGSLPDAVMDHTATLLADGRGLVVGLPNARPSLVNRSRVVLAPWAAAGAVDVTTSKATTRPTDGPQGDHTRADTEIFRDERNSMRLKSRRS
jgi:hypothetical protein